jgi:hypothetical protein
MPGASLVVEHERHAKQDERGRADDRGLPVLDEIVFGVVKNAQH